MRPVLAGVAIFSIVLGSGVSAPAVAHGHATAAAGAANAHVRIIVPGETAGCSRLASALPAAALATSPYQATVRCGGGGRSARFLVESNGDRNGTVRDAGGATVTVTTVFE